MGEIWNSKWQHERRKVKEARAEDKALLEQYMMEYEEVEDALRERMVLLVSFSQTTL